MGQICAKIQQIRNHFGIFSSFCYNARLFHKARMRQMPNKQDKKMPAKKAPTYKDSGVDIDEGNALVDALKPLVKSTFSPQVIGGIGSFAGAFALPKGYSEPVILAATDGVGTKLRLAIDADRLDSVGIDLVAMCVNDLICNFATPLFFLDYYATGKLDKKAALRVIEGIVKGCKQANCSLIGGESAEMPGMYHGKDFDLAGFAVGIAEKSELESPPRVKEGDILMGLPSSGLHSNGYSLARKVLFETLGMKFEDKLGKRTLIDILLEPTKIYVSTFKKYQHFINALAHITGGGIIENLPRVLPKGLGAQIDTSSIPEQEIFTLLSQHIDRDEAYRVFNMGVGMIFAVSQENTMPLLKNTNAFVLGKVVKKSGVVLV